jgi:dephospho-CoA kinase
MRRIGLTGGIGSGKSVVAGMLRDFGALIVDTDAIARQISAPGGVAIPALRERFGDDAIDATGALNRDRMRALAFADPDTRGALEAVLHPLIGAEAERQAAGASQGQTIVFDVPLLVESGRWRARVARVLVVDCSTETQIERVMQRSGWERSAVERVIGQQASREARRAAADAVIHNDGLSLDELRQAVYTLWQRWRL